MFLHPSLSEGLSNATLEAMAVGLPVVVTDVSGMRELVTDGVNERSSHRLVTRPHWRPPFGIWRPTPSSAPRWASAAGNGPSITSTSSCAHKPYSSTIDESFASMPRRRKIQSIRMDWAS